MNTEVNPTPEDLETMRQRLEEAEAHLAQLGEHQLINARLLAESEANFRALSENAIEAIFIVNQRGNFAYVNHQACELLGYTREELLGKHFAAVIHPYDLPLVTERWEARLRGEPSPNRYEIQIVRKDGSSAPVEMSVALTQWNGETATVALAHDITQRRELERALAAELHLRSVLAELSKNLLSPFDLEKLSDLALQEAQQLTKSPLGFIGYQNPYGMGEFVGLMVQAEPQKGIFAKYSSSFDSLMGLWSWVTREGKAVFSNDLAKDFGEYPFKQSHIPIERLLMAPAKVNEHIMGLIAVANAAEPYRSTHAEVLERFADLYALALQRHWHEEALRQESRRAASLAQISQQIVACQRDLPVLLETVARHTAESLQATCGIYLCDETKQALSLAAFSHPDPLLLSVLSNALKPHRIPIKNPPWQEVLGDAQPLFWEALPHPHLPIVTQPPLHKVQELVGIHSLMILPLRASHLVFGVIVLCRHKGERALTAKDFTFAQEVANRLSLGMANARLVTDLEVQQSLLELRVAERTAELQAEREFILQVMNSIDTGITVVDRNQHFIFVNRAFADMLGYSPEALVGKKPTDITVPNHQLFLESQWKSRLEGRTITAFTRKENEQK
ncbi:MAG: PAS domain S-box protein [Anaerolineales bacterium]|nr:PAS domain S-box protein [Anaerolineales bacterium]